MKKIIYGLLALSLFSCADFIEEDNKSSVDAETFYLTPEGFQSLIDANYSQLREIYGNDAFVFCAGTDLYAVGSGRGTEPDGLSRYLQLNPSSDGGIEELYASCYQAIQRANTALYYSEITEQTANVSTLVGEVKYLRANAYFLLVQSFGGVGIVDEFIQSPTLSFDRNSAEEVYAKIISDLEDALDLVSDGSYVGKVNKRAVQHLLAKVYLTRAYESFGQASDFATAASYAEDAIAGQSLSISFADLWEPGNEMNAETIFSVQFSSGSIATDPTNLGHKQANWFSSYLGGPDVAGDAPWRSYNLLATDFALGLYTQDDERYEATFMTEVFTRYYAAYDGDNGTAPAGQKSHYYVPQWATQADIDAYTLANPTAQIHLWGRMEQVW
ncbi:RagB/SusD family nutrient uptake outer membrane protein [Flavobacterium sediminis]|uniref:RagB/SusD family nutrient uptake outer membrane protein n=1 Tax=Flavobacterium sediminis TaxID=2201181 RepID=UPI001FED21FD|nr:RagB/SusD family nutrient uptake outer membrane protein [Flavobacterium sediminis]